MLLSETYLNEAITEYRGLKPNRQYYAKKREKSNNRIHNLNVRQQAV